MNRAGSPRVHVVAHGETLTKISRLHGTPISEVTSANKTVATANLIAKPKTAWVAQENAIKPGSATPTNRSESALIFGPALGPEAAPPKDFIKPADQPSGTLSKFRWPATGRVIADFGGTVNGQQNAGINIALPENTPVKAAEDGVVAYAGNELTAYGNLVQIRHSDGYFTVYAHTKEILVKRGDPVKRGQLIARSGQTGKVNSPQLHFQVRKGAAPLDPMIFLKGV